ncbi:MAG: hypothetical protein AUJ92_03910 [Armatimonadetes bacterium CG2_30_59_28]|nr:MAG: hypothetical protein AUJ92_03910 [Armatimonadetes bacterium CG2_30_59_28]PIU61361.1 MAG: hypothetical protein COS85_21180 [Armatimonadetes bacterium CG07_land_8_20_14_0_80_59_28]PIX38788.1 MAG: hypothetical protein COZ56_19550 [Armatimonadetes bacterium CG_4_8_14_3_um_filter_58_9]PIY40839.1 MAG: hypothetical protein COZ05_16620 [Armatimonadetes bacterium CG_4_10_14_3_um_filter_59_10]PJB61678.1 MAG: hypothetical protein CO095_20115 [Armatimonadetes bacterium CG_4_9_14_3_um_filter_58_7]
MNPKNKGLVMTIKRQSLWLVIAGLAMAATVWRSESQQDPTTAKDKVREIAIKAEKARYNNKTGITTFTGNVVVTQSGEKFEMTADRVEYEEETDSAVATGNLTFKDPDTTITGNKIHSFFGEKKALITGNVKLTSQGKAKKGDEGKRDGSLRDRYKKKKTTMTCDQIEYLYSDGKAVATGNLKFTQEDKKGAAKKATYLEEEEQIILEEDVEVINEKGEKLRCRKATIYIDDDSMEAEGVEAVLIRKEAKKEKVEGPKSVKPETSTESKPAPEPEPKPDAEKPAE